MGLFEKLTAKAKASRQRIVLPEGTEPRTLTAADRIIAEGIADIILIGDPKEINTWHRSSNSPTSTRQR